MKRALAGVTALLVVLLAATPVLAQESVDIVHSERVALGSSGRQSLRVSFTDWPIRARRSMDFLFEPTGGIKGRTLELRAVSPSGETVALGIPGLLGIADPEDWQLPRHPRARHAWGLDVVALPEEGTWRFEFIVRGPEGTSTGTLPIQAGAAPGPPFWLTWTIGLLPWLTVPPLLAYAWIRTRPVRAPIARRWSG